MLHLVDSVRPEEVKVRIWYPAAKAGESPAPYLPDADRLKGTAAWSSMQNLFGPSWTQIASKTLGTHSYDDVAIVGGGRLPILLFSPGGGVPVIAYTAQMESLASYGYVVVGVDHKDGTPAVENKSPEEFEKKITEMRARDLASVIDRFSELDKNATSVFHSKLDVSRVGVFGHSRGGRTAARMCQIDQRVKACLNEDGSFLWQPFWLDEDGRSLRSPFMMLDHLDAELPDEVFKKMGTTQEEYVRRRSARQAEAREKLYSTVAGGSYHVTIKTPGISHNSFSDVRLLGRADAETINSWPKEVQAATPHAHILEMINALTRAFFDRHVRGVSGSIAELAGVPAGEVEIREYGSN